MLHSLGLPPSGWVKLNTDGSSRGNPGEATGGGLIRDETGKWLVGFGLNIGICSVTAAELWALYHGLMIAWMEGHRKVAVTVDSSAVVTLVSREPERTNPHAPLISACLTKRSPSLLGAIPSLG